MEQNKTNLVDLAREAREKAFAPYSNFRVGAVVLASDGQIFSGCNIESASFGLTVCAERVAIWKAVSEGVTEFASISVVVDTEELTPPCGVCRQIIWEFCGDIPITLANLRGGVETVTTREILPRAFDRRFFK
jgi:cytidine deaminase